MTTAGNFLIEINISNKGASAAASQIDNVSKSLSTAGTRTQGFQKSYASLMGMAIKSIPVWYLMRTAYLSAFKAFREGIDFIVEADKGLARAMAVSTNQTKEFESAMKKVGRQLMVETGASATDVYEAFYQLGTSGIEASEAMAGMSVILKTSVAMMGDVEKTGRAVADIYNRFGDSIEGASTPMEKFEQIGATMTILWQKNNFLLNEFTDSFKTFGATAQLANLTFDETSALIATVNNLMIRGTSGGTSLSRSFQFMIQNVKELNKFLKDQGAISKDVNLNQTDLLELWQKTAQVINKLGPKEAAAIKAVQDIFGTKAAGGIAAIAKSYEFYQKNIELLANSKGKARVDELTKAFELQQKTIAIQASIFKNLSNIMVEGFLMALTGTDDFASALKNINSTMKALMPVAIALGAVLNAMWNTITLRKYTAEFQEMGIVFANLFSKDLPKLVKEFKSRKIFDVGDLLTVDFEKAVLDQISNLTGNTGVIAQAEAKTFTDAFIKELKEANKQSEAAGVVVGEKYVKGFQTGFHDNIKKIFKGEDVDFFGEMSDLLEDQIAEAMADGVTDGLRRAFNGAGEIFQGIKDFFETPTSKMYDAILKGSEDGSQKFYDAIVAATNKQPTEPSTDIMSILSQPGYGRSTKQINKGLDVLNATVGLDYGTSQTPSAGGSSWLSKMMGSAGGFVGSMGGMKTLMSIGLSSYGLSKGIGSQTGLGLLGSTIGGIGLIGSTKGLLGNIPAFNQAYKAGGLMGGLGTMLRPANQGGFQGSGFGGALMGIGGGINAYQGFRSGNTMGGIGGTLQGIGGVMSMFGGPVGMVGMGLSLVGTIMNLFGGSKTKTQVQTQKETFQVSSKIDITNKRLEMINRDVRAIKQTFETYILQESAYFSESTVSERFGIDSKRLLQ